MLLRMSGTLSVFNNLLAHASVWSLRRFKDFPTTIVVLSSLTSEVQSSCIMIVASSPLSVCENSQSDWRCKISWVFTIKSTFSHISLSMKCKSASKHRCHRQYCLLAAKFCSKQMSAVILSALLLLLLLGGIELLANTREKIFPQCALPRSERDKKRKIKRKTERYLKIIWNSNLFNLIILFNSLILLPSNNYKLYFEIARDSPYATRRSG